MKTLTCFLMITVFVGQWYILDGIETAHNTPGVYNDRVIVKERPTTKELITQGHFFLTYMLWETEDRMVWNLKDWSAFQKKFN